MTSIKKLLRWVSNSRCHKEGEKKRIQGNFIWARLSNNLSFKYHKLGRYFIFNVKFEVL